jgi:membrane protease YdiL (CAAX protease family)
MEPELQRPAEEIKPAASWSTKDSLQDPLEPRRHEQRGFEWILVGPHGLRTGWSILLFASMYYLFRMILGTIFYSAGLVGDTNDATAPAVLVAELILLFSLLGATLVMAFVEGRRVSSYNLAGPRPVRHFFAGTAAGFLALSLLVAALAWGGWLSFAPASLSGVQAIRFGALWCAAFLVVGAVEEGLFRCYALFTLARGVSFWWALAAETVICLYLFVDGGGNGAWGVYAVAALGFFPCLVLHQKAAPRSGFWQAAWVTSTFFGFYHTNNNGENWIGVFAAGAIGFVFCVSVRLTGSVWWAIGCHTAWDWAETFFYGTADSGLEGTGHYLTASPAGNPLWSGGSDGPEGSLLVIGVILLLLLALLAIYGRRKAVRPGPLAMEQAAG